MSEALTQEIIREVGDSWYTLKVDGTKDLVGMENVSIVIRFFLRKNDMKKRKSKKCFEL